jgi:hypothetical protein
MELIQNSLILYYRTITKFNNDFSKITSVKFIDSVSDTNRSKIIINNVDYKYSIIGRFDSSTNFWEWGWSFETIKNKIYDTRNFLIYGLEHSQNEDTLIKDILINSKIKINDDINLDIILGLSLYLLTTKKYIYTFKIKESDTITKYIALQL